MYLVGRNLTNGILESDFDCFGGVQRNFAQSPSRSPRDGPEKLRAISVQFGLSLSKYPNRFPQRKTHHPKRRKQRAPSISLWTCAVRPYKQICYNPQVCPDVI